MNKIELIKDFYGFTTKEAKNYLKNATENQIKEIQNYFINNSKKSFYND